MLLKNEVFLNVIKRYLFWYTFMYIINSLVSRGKKKTVTLLNYHQSSTQYENKIRIA